MMDSQLPYVAQFSRVYYETHQDKPATRAGDPCPNCHTGRLDYDGLLNLSCPDCGYTAGDAGAGCT